MTASRIWFTSDLHLGHRKVSELRGFESTLDHDLEIVDIWSEQVRPGDQVWVLGDIAVSDPKHALATLNGLPGEKHLIWGNHDQGHPMHRNAHRKAQRYTYPAFAGGYGPSGVFASAQMAARRRINGRSVLLSHFPYMGDTLGRAGDRHVSWRLQLDSGDPAPIIHGHTHRDERFSEIAVGPFGEQGWLHVPQIHVGWDAWQRLVSLEEIAEMLR